MLRSDGKVDIAFGGAEVRPPSRGLSLGGIGGGEPLAAASAAVVRFGALLFPRRVTLL